MFSIVDGSGKELTYGNLPLRPAPPDKPRGRIATFTESGQVAGDYKCVPRELISRPSRYHIKGTETISFDGSKVFVDPGWTLPNVDDLKKRRVEEIKNKAGAIINAAFPDWKQRNMIAAGVDLQDVWRLTGSWTAEQQTIAATLKAAWAWVDQVRIHSNVLESEVTALSNAEDVAAWVDHDWPEAL